MSIIKRDPDCCRNNCLVRIKDEQNMLLQYQKHCCAMTIGSELHISIIGFDFDSGKVCHFYFDMNIIVIQYQIPIIHNGLHDTLSNRKLVSTCVTKDAMTLMKPQKLCKTQKLSTV